MRYLLHDVFIKSARDFPNNIAITVEGQSSITYADLNTLSNKFANFYKSLKGEIRENPYVGILSAVHEKSIAAVLGTLKIGGTYVPLDEHSPINRLANILKNTNLDVIVMDAIWYEKYKDFTKLESVKKIILLGDLEVNNQEKVVSYQTIINSSDRELPTLNQVSDDLAYILHSSGSTGVPKGIMLTHRNARTFVDWMQKEFQLTSEDVVMSRAPFKFDLSVFDIFNTLNSGATLVCFDWNKIRESEQKHIDYVKLMEEQSATILYTTPSTFITFMNRGGLEQADLKLREVMYAGEPFPTPQLRRLQEVLPNTKIANIYGPTETNIITYYWIDKLPEDDTAVPLGGVVDDTEILVVSEDATKLCEPGEIGELWCRGGTVTIGYLGMEEKTKESLVVSPFHKYPVKFWRTGDFGYRDEQGVLYYKGRRDHIVKVKGFRIELGEIESALAKNENLDEFVVVAVPDEKYGSRLYCFYSTIHNVPYDGETLGGFLKDYIPEYMIPFRFVQKEVLPKTSSGKVDRVGLAEEAAKY